MAITSTATTHSAPIRRNATSRPPTTLQLLRETLSQDAAQPSPASATAHSEGAPGPGFSERQVALLSAPLDRAHVRQREQGRSRVSYLEGWQVIAEANRIFGFDGWERCTLISRCVAEHERPIGRDRKNGWGVTYTARVRITVTAGNRTLIREGSGAGHGIDADKGLAHESALKEAETDATKRALMTFGNPFGLALYDKQQRQVSDGKPVAAATKSPSAEMADVPLQPSAITGLQERIKALAPARLEAFSKGFRTAFQVPDTQPSLAGLITTSRHKRWIEGFLAETATA
ncbi:RAD52 family DNA repair protein [Synechococcus sp. CB0101]|uniref:RAD52 family DNA repair protein n=1 Tax=Synechococcus sp. CB0101 TaxID=232348 RepID=UPI00020012CD|nr:RAD52 family DNA repair protein [Synechococcus sp. CB0101]